jgi:hypothetical protein
MRKAEQAAARDSPNGSPVSRCVPVKSEQLVPWVEALDFAPYFALNGGASDFHPSQRQWLCRCCGGRVAKASSFANATEDRTPDKSQGKQDRFAHHRLLGTYASLRLRSRRQHHKVPP